MLKAHLERMRLGMEREKERLAALQNAIDNQNKELDDAAVAEREKECLKHAATEESEKECLTPAAIDTGSMKIRIGGMEALVQKMRLLIIERNRKRVLQNAIDNQNKELDDAAVAEKEKECLKDTENLKVLTYYHRFCETVGLVPKTKEHID